MKKPFQHPFNAYLHFPLMPYLIHEDEMCPLNVQGSGTTWVGIWVPPATGRVATGTD